MSSDEPITATPPAKPIDVVLLWHMHQPEYRDLRSGVFHQPWTYLHIIKDYTDMAAHLEANPDARAVVNFVPVLLDQIEEYSQQLQDYLNGGSVLRDHLLAALAEPVMTDEPGHRIKLIRECLRANEVRLIQRFPHFNKLARMARDIIANHGTLGYYGDQFLFDLLVWYHLAWMGETVRRDNKVVKALIEKGSFYTCNDRRQLIEVIYQLVRDIIPRYRKLAEKKRIEISMTPYAHPISPLLLDFSSAREAMPDVAMPESPAYPGGETRNRWHIDKGLRTFERHFGFKPSGCWPAEGSVSEDAIAAFDKAGFDWLATGETVLRNSLTASGLTHDQCIHRGWNLNRMPVTCFFRDDGISDMIGFKFQDWHADDAVGHLIDTLKHIHSACSDNPSPLVSIVLDGENAWEHYPENGYYFLSALYKKLAREPGIRLTTYSEHLTRRATQPGLSKLVAGSWVYGTFSTWIGDKDKNLAWDMLVEAKKVYDEVMAEGSLNDHEIERAEMQLATCESSDWFWWFGDYNPAESVRAFDKQYRLHLSNLYLSLHRNPPEYLSRGFSSGSEESRQSGVMLPGKQN
jgi:alpha-amylase/alpha-mannosidase (GH57 family)